MDGWLRVSAEVRAWVRLGLLAWPLLHPTPVMNVTPAPVPVPHHELCAPAALAAMSRVFPCGSGVMVEFFPPFAGPMLAMATEWAIGGMVILRQYMACAQESAASLDDLISDATTIALGLHAACRKVFTEAGWGPERLENITAVVRRQARREEMRSEQAGEQPAGGDWQGAGGRVKRPPRHEPAHERGGGKFSTSCRQNPRPGRQGRRLRQWKNLRAGEERIAQGVPELVAAVDAGEVSVSAAAALRGSAQRPSPCPPPLSACGSEFASGRSRSLSSAPRSRLRLRADAHRVRHGLAGRLHHRCAPTSFRSCFLSE